MSRHILQQCNFFRATSHSSDRHHVAAAVKPITNDMRLNSLLHIGKAFQGRCHLACVSWNISQSECGRQCHGVTQQIETLLCTFIVLPLFLPIWLCRRINVRPFQVRMHASPDAVMATAGPAHNCHNVTAQHHTNLQFKDPAFITGCHTRVHKSNGRAWVQLGPRKLACLPQRRRIHNT